MGYKAHILSLLTCPSFIRAPAELTWMCSPLLLLRPYFLMPTITAYGTVCCQVLVSLGLPDWTACQDWVFDEVKSGVPAVHFPQSGNWQRLSGIWIWVKRVSDVNKAYPWVLVHSILQFIVEEYEMYLQLGFVMDLAQCNEFWNGKKCSSHWIMAHTHCIPYVFTQFKLI